MKLLKAGVPMGEIDRMDVARYLDVLAFEILNTEEREPPERDATGGNVVELRRGTIDQIFL